jgi:hypothetical protein
MLLVGVDYTNASYMDFTADEPHPKHLHSDGAAAESPIRKGAQEPLVTWV